MAYTETSFETSDAFTIPLIEKHADPAKPSIVFLHGWTSNKEAWEPIISQLDNYNIYAWDARLHTQETTIERMAQDLNELIKDKNIKPIVVGHSMGTLTLFEYIRQFGTSNFEKMVILDQSPKLLTDDEWTLGIYGDFTQIDNEKFTENLQKDFIETIMRFVCVSENRLLRRLYVHADPLLDTIRDRLKHLEPNGFITTWNTFVSKDYRDVLPKIDIPALAIFGGQSNFYPPAIVDYTRDNMPNVRTKVYEDGSHSPQFEFPHRFVEDLTLFINE